MDDFTSLMTLCILMFILTFIVGYLPMTIKLSERKLETISIIGAGFLLGTSLMVIVPEGLAVLMEVKGVLPSHDHSNININNNNNNNNHNHDHSQHNDNDNNHDNNNNWLFWSSPNDRRILSSNIDNINIDNNPISKYLNNEENREIYYEQWNTYDKSIDNTRRLLLSKQQESHTRHLNNDQHEHDHDPDHAHSHEQSHEHDHEHEEYEEYHQHHHSHDPAVHGVFKEMGIVVCFGFIFMMAIEKLSGDSHGHDHSHGGHSHSHDHSHDHLHNHNHRDSVSLGAHNSHSQLHGTSHRETSHHNINQNGYQNGHSKITSNEEEREVLIIKTNSPTTQNDPITSPSTIKLNEDLHDKNKQRSQTTKLLSFMVGLLTHAAVDGIALGAVSAEGNAQSLSLLVFVALMGHKAPAAVSVTTFLKRKAHPRKEIIKQIVAFSAAAPVFAILTYFVLDTLFVGVMGGSLGGSEALGWCLLFSGGTFLYVVTLHILPEIKSWRESNDYQLTWIDIALLAIGCIIPSFFEHSH